MCLIVAFGQKKYPLQQQERYEYQPKQRQYQQQVENNQYEFYDQQQQYEPSYNYPEPQGQIVERNYETGNRSRCPNFPNSGHVTTPSKDQLFPHLGAS